MNDLIPIEDLLYDDLVNSLWGQLVLEGNFDLIKRLRKIELLEPGFSTIIVPDEGFSELDITHNLVLDWLEAHDANIINVNIITTYLKEVLPK